MSAKEIHAPHDCARCGRRMTLESELSAETYTEICDPCATKPCFVEAVQALDQAKVWSCPSSDPASRLRIIKIGYPGCGSCDGKGCDICLTTYNNHPVRQWIKEREGRLQRAVQSVYDAALKKEGIYEMAQKNCAPVGRLKRALGPLTERYNRALAVWRALVVSRLRPISFSRR